MNTSEKKAILTLSLMAAFADGGKSDIERAELKRIAEKFPDAEVDLPALYHRVLMEKPSVAQEVQALATPEARQLAYEIALCVCEADDALNEPEKQFLADLRRELRLEAGESAVLEQQAEKIATAPIEDPVLPPVLPDAAPPAQSRGTAADMEIDKMILNYSILNGALELMPETLATMAIVPLQMKMVYRIGKTHGYELDRGHIKELVGVAGVGLTSQVVEGYVRKLLGGLLGKVGGGLLKGAGHQLASSATSFASTWALGRMAQQYYAAGRKLSAIELRQIFGSFAEKAGALHTNYASQIRDKAASLNLRQLMPMLSGTR